MVFYVANVTGKRLKNVRAVLILIILSGENEKFYALQEEKQSQILNAAYKVFASNQYKKAPTSEIAAEAGISKSLLFHYFHNKLELYLFLWKYAADLTKKYMCKYKVSGNDKSLGNGLWKGDGK